MAGERDLVAPFELAEAFQEGCIVSQGSQRRQLFRIVQERIADGFANETCKARIALLQPAARGDAVGLVVDAPGIELVQVGKHRLFHEFGVQRGHAIDAVRAGKCQVGHAHAPFAILVNQGDRRDRRSSMSSRRRALRQIGVDGVDDLHVPGQQPLEQGQRPLSRASGSRVWLV